MGEELVSSRMGTGGRLPLLAPQHPRAVPRKCDMRTGLQVLEPRGGKDSAACGSRELGTSRSHAVQTMGITTGNL